MLRRSHARTNRGQAGRDQCHFRQISQPRHSCTHSNPSLIQRARFILAAPATGGNFWSRVTSHYLTGKFNDTIPVTGPDIATFASFASDSRKICTVPGAGRPSRALICDNGTLGNSLSSHSIVGDGTNKPTYSRSFLRSRLISAIRGSIPAGFPCPSPPANPRDARFIQSASLTIPRRVVPRITWSGTLIVVSSIRAAPR